MAALAAARTRVSRLAPTGVQGSCVRGKPAPGSRSWPGDGGPQISRGTGFRETPGGTSAPVFVPDAPGRIGVPSP
jgi:hypothetical protein